MRRTILIAGCLAGALLLTPVHAQTIANDRQQVESWLKSKYPTIGVADYARGELAFGAEPPARWADAAQRADALARGKIGWERKFKNGKSLASCFPNGGKRVAATYPQFDAKTAQVVTFEGAINRCLTLYGQPEVNFTADRNAGEMLAYARSLSKGIPTNVRVPTKEAQTQYDAGKRLFYTRLGSRNQACASCHVRHAGEVMLEQTLTAAIGQTTNWPRINPDGTIATLQSQYQACFRRVGAEAPATGSAAMNGLEYFHTGLSARMALGQ